MDAAGYRVGLGNPRTLSGIDLFAVGEDSEQNFAVFALRQATLERVIGGLLPSDAYLIADILNTQLAPVDTAKLDVPDTDDADDLHGDAARDAYAPGLAR